MASEDKSDINSVDLFIPREIESKELENILNAFEGGLNKVVDFGGNLVKWDIEVAKGGDDNLPIILSLRHFIELIDSVSILVKKSSIDPCKLILRGALETYFSLEYLLEKNTPQRSMAFLVWHTHKKLKTYYRLDNSKQESKSLANAIRNDKLLSDFQLPAIPDIQNAIDNLQSLLKEPHYLEGEAEYQRLRASGEKNPTWYRLFDGPKKIEDLAKYLNLSSLYEMLYRDWSGPTHGTDIIQGKIFGNDANSVDIVQIRYFKDAQSITSWALTISLRAYQTFIEKRVPNKKPEFLKWYSTISELYKKVASKGEIITIKE